MSEDLLKRLELLHDRVAHLVEARSCEDPTAGDPLRGLVLSPAAVHHQLTRRIEPAPDDDAYGVALRNPDGRLLALAERFALSPLDLHILLVALAPDVNRRFEPLYGYLNDNVSRRRATVTLALELAGLQPDQTLARSRFHPSAPLITGSLLMMDDDPRRPLPGRALRVPERVVAYLLGDDTIDGSLIAAELITEHFPSAMSPFAERLSQLLVASAERPPVIYLHGSGTDLAAVALSAAGYPVLRTEPLDHELLPALIREARLRDAALLVGPLPADPARLVRTLESASVPVVMTGPAPYDPRWSSLGTPIPLEAPPPLHASPDVWRSELGPGADHLDVASTVAPYRLTPGQVRRAAHSALALATLDGRPLSSSHLQQAARRQSAPLLDRHARRLHPRVGWADLVLPPEPLAMLHELVQRAQYRDQVLGQWRMRTGGGRGHGLIALFAGESGTGKTMSAEVVAGELGMDLYVVDLSSIVDKYIGETEKNLERIFTEADRSDAVLLFDEADAVFGKRSEVKDSHDKHANMQSAYLLQRLEQFDGIALLTTNLRANIDEAFTRRLDLIVDFPFPDAVQRELLWRHSLANVPGAAELDLASVSSSFELSGGGIHSAAVTAAYLAAGRGDSAVQDDLFQGALREYRKSGRLTFSDNPH
ncbi:ATP-binding protein [Kineosporia babensis]|uniref:ATP-binding protein n=1 Tax=Kineosporia babensis TaxID=499548 RepID=A0A9X1NB12_9ACTN|nr:ATP-binding protein [Kineosporia babensis]MCD5310544.1 ATP-binding protein [Kineosporia babensis]